MSANTLLPKSKRKFFDLFYIHIICTLIYTVHYKHIYFLTISTWGQKKNYLVDRSSKYQHRGL